MILLHLGRVEHGDETRARMLQAADVLGRASSKQHDDDFRVVVYGSDLSDLLVDEDRNADEKPTGKELGPYCPVCGENRSIAFKSDERECGYCDAKWRIISGRG
jgi:hypothetical protein